MLQGTRSNTRSIGALVALYERAIGIYASLVNINAYHQLGVEADKFPDQILDKTQLQRFLGFLNYVAEFIPQLSNFVKSLHQRLNKNPSPWTEILGFDLDREGFSDLGKVLYYWNDFMPLQVLIFHCLDSMFKHRSLEMI
ncbi:hypothetical protein K1719_003048 [Acacia pycnantha]|nr:hypothetical protein K1719_003048 [Acacia pycnantha]